MTGEASRSLELRGKRVTVFGLGRFGGGIAVTQWLVAQGATVLVADEDTPARLADSVHQLAGLPVVFHLGQQKEEHFTQVDCVVASPAVPPHNPLLLAARAAGVAVTTEIRLFVERCPAEIYAVTGTKGKSTTTAMLGQMLARVGVTHVGGNIGVSLLNKLPAIRPDDRVVLELSSYMLEHLGAARWSPRVAVVTLLGADHLEWHGSRQAYVEAKRNIVRFQHPQDWLVINGDDPGTAELAAGAPSQVTRYSLTGAKEFTLRIPGRHNQLNAQGAFAAARIAGVSWDQASESLADFPGLPHRLQLVCERDGVRWYNDSIATIPEAASAALGAFEPQTVIQIIGGKDKHLAIESLCSILSARAKAVLCIGQTADMLAASVPGSRVCGDLANAVETARKLAAPGDIVLLSPGYPSFDQFVNFEDRGNQFVRLASQR